MCGFGVSMYILTKNGTKWASEFMEMCSLYVIIHQHAILTYS
jgi:hypothetical protein